MRYLDLLKKRPKPPTKGTAKTALTPFGSKGSTHGRHFSPKKEVTEVEQSPPNNSAVFTKSELKAQQDSTDFVTFCLAHQNSFPDGHCLIKDNRHDGLTGCLGWESKKAGRLPEEYLKLTGRDREDSPSLSELLRESREAR